MRFHESQNEIIMKFNITDGKNKNYVVPTGKWTCQEKLKNNDFNWFQSHYHQWNEWLEQTGCIFCHRYEAFWNFIFDNIIVKKNVYKCF